VIRRLSSLVAVLRSRIGLLVGAILAAIGGQIVAVAIAGIAAYMVGIAVIGTTESHLRSLATIMAALILPAVVLPFVETVVVHLFAYRILYDLRQRVYEQFRQLIPAYFLERRSGDIGAAIVADIELLERFFAHTFPPLVVAIVVPFLAIVVLAFISPPLATIAALAALAVASAPVWQRKHASQQGLALRNGIGDLSAELLDSIAGVREVLSFDATEHAVARLRTTMDRVTAVRVSDAGRSGFERALVDIAVSTGFLAIVVTGAALVAADGLPAQLLPACAILAAAAFGPVVTFARGAHEFGSVIAAADRVFGIISAQPLVVDRVSEAPEDISPSIRFRNVVFRYDAQAAVLCDVSFTIGPGERVALVGRSGAGKSTCASLLMRFWDVESGAIELGGRDLRDFPQASLRANIAYVPQDGYLFNASVRANVRVGRFEATDAEIDDALELAFATDFVRSLPDGPQTVLGERGSRLSGGQRQRIAIARALLRDAPILVLDEAASNLDVDSEATIAEAVAALAERRTTLVVAHRLSTIKRCDRIVMLDGGRVAEIGTYAELIARGGSFAKLVESASLST
jgi:ATP-binding cassette subfamily C protein CydC